MSFSCDIKTKFLLLGVAISCLVSTQVHAQNLTEIPGDVNGDLTVNILDVQETINQALGAVALTLEGDSNKDRVVNILDVQTNINIVLGRLVIVALAPSPGAIGSNITIHGQNFLTSGGANRVSFNGVLGFVQQVITINNQNIGLVVTVPQGATNGSVSVNGSNTLLFEVSIFPSNDLTAAQPAGFLNVMLNGDLVSVASNQLILTFDSDASSTDYLAVENRVNSDGGSIVGQNPPLNEIQIESLDVNASLQTLASFNNVKKVGFNFEADLLRDPVPDISSFPPYPSTSPLTGGYWIDTIRARSAWDLTIGKSDFPIGIVDSGIDVNSGHFDNKTVSFFNFGNPPIGDNGKHGTAVAGLVGSRGDDGVLFCGVAWRNPLLVSNDFDSNYFVRVGITRLINRGAKVINVSIGDDDAQLRFREEITSAILYAKRKKVLICFAAGNDGNKNDDQILPNGSPQEEIDAWRTNTIIVAATDVDNSIPRFSKEGDVIDIAAPGVGITAALANFTNAHFEFGGTSASAPFVTGAAALIRGLKPLLPASEIKRILKATASPVSGGAKVGSGLLNLGAAVHLAAGVPLPPSQLSALAISSTEVELTWQDNSEGPPDRSIEEDVFVIERMDPGPTSFVEVGSVNGVPGSGNTVTFVDGTLSPSISYVYRVRARNQDNSLPRTDVGIGISIPTNEVTVTTLMGGGSSGGGTGGSLSIMPSASFVPFADVGQNFGPVDFVVSGGTGPFLFQFGFRDNQGQFVFPSDPNTVVPGLTFTPMNTSVRLEGIPTTSGSHDLRVQVIDNGPNGSFGNFDFFLDVFSGPGSGPQP